MIFSLFATMCARPEGSYTKLSLAEMDELKAKLTACCPDGHKTDRLTQFHHYDRNVNYHEEDTTI